MHATDGMVWRRKVRGQLPALTEAEMRHYRSALYGVAAAVGHVSRMSLAGDFQELWVIHGICCDFLAPETAVHQSDVARKVQPHMFFLVCCVRTLAYMLFGVGQGGTGMELCMQLVARLHQPMLTR